MAVAAEKVVELVKVSAAHAERSKAEITRLKKEAAAQQALQKQAEALIPSVVEALVAHGRIAPEQREKAAAALANPVRTMELFRQLAAHQPNDTIGRPVAGEKQANTRQRAIGERGGEEERPHWQRFRNSMLPAN